MTKAGGGDLLVTELLGGLLPLGPDGEVVHGEGRVAGHVLGGRDEGRKFVEDLLVVHGGEGLQEDQTTASRVTRVPAVAKMLSLSV